jgi:polyhydroxyalkanoate synthesis regulator phasin
MHATDILQYEKELKEAGVSDKEAEIHARKLALILDDTDTTQKNVDGIRSDIAQLNVRMIALESKLDWLAKVLAIVGSLIAIAVALPALVQLFLKL